MNASELSAAQAARTSIITGWFRNPDAWTALDKEVLPNFQTPRIWTGACGSGEEAYTAAIFAAAHGGRILATDINPTMIALAIAAKYQSKDVMIDAISARIAAPSLAQAFLFDAKTGEAKPRQEIRDLVKFGVLDLNFDAPPECDIAILANVWRHLDPDAAAHLLGQLQRRLGQQGRLVIGGSDVYPTPELAAQAIPGKFLALLSEHFAEAEHDLIWRPL